MNNLIVKMIKLGILLTCLTSQFSFHSLNYISIHMDIYFHNRDTELRSKSIYNTMVNVIKLRFSIFYVEHDHFRELQKAYSKFIIGSNRIIDRD